MSSVTKATGCDFGMDDPQCGGTCPGSSGPGINCVNSSQLVNFESNLWAGSRKFHSHRLYNTNWDSLISDSYNSDKTNGRRSVTGCRSATTNNNPENNDVWGTRASAGTSDSTVKQICVCTTTAHTTAGDRDVKLNSLADNLIAEDHDVDVCIDHEPYLWSNVHASYGPHTHEAVTHSHAPQMDPGNSTPEPITYPSKGSANDYVYAIHHCVTRIRERWASQGVSEAAKRKIRFTTQYTAGQFRSYTASRDFWKSQSTGRMGVVDLSTIIDVVGFAIYSINSSGGFANGTSSIGFQGWFEGDGRTWPRIPRDFINDEAKKPWCILEWGTNPNANGSTTGNDTWLNDAHAYIKQQASDDLYGCVSATYFFDLGSSQPPDGHRWDHTPTVNGARDADLGTEGEEFWDMAHDPYFQGQRYGRRGFARLSL